MESAEKKRPGDILTGALIGLARTTYSHLKTENTDRVVTCALSVLVRVDADEKELEKQLEQVRAEKLAVAPAAPPACKVRKYRRLRYGPLLERTGPGTLS